MEESSLDLPRIAANSWIRTFVHEKQVASTNSLAMQIITSGASELPLVVLADEQFAGRGRGNNSWFSTTGSLTMSVGVAREMLTLTPQSMYSLGVALAVLKVLRQCISYERLALKWPNDVMCDGKKIAGILLETAGAPRGGLVVGIGVNVNNDLRAAPLEVQSVATSVRAALGQEVDRTALICRLIYNLQSLFAPTTSEAGLISEYRPYDWLAGKRISVRRGNDVLTGDSRGIDDSGSLLLATSTGLISVVSGTVEQVSE